MNIQDWLGVLGFGLAMLALIIDWRRWDAQRGGLRVRLESTGHEGDDPSTLLQLKITNYSTGAIAIESIGCRRWFGQRVILPDARAHQSARAPHTGSRNNDLVAQEPERLPARREEGGTRTIFARLPAMPRRTADLVVWDASGRAFALPRSELDLLRKDFARHRRIDMAEL